ncbi:hypothetical protein THS27_02315 [Thalassospira sp. MCCC 1A01428]|nr:hypothetical protein THS27_02315 [Thalassospira sp. MCCC 1A01428]
MGPLFLIGLERRIRIAPENVIVVANYPPITSMGSKPEKDGTRNPHCRPSICANIDARQEPKGRLATRRFIFIPLSQQQPGLSGK